MCFSKVLNWHNEYHPAHVKKLKQWQKDFHNHFMWLRVPGCEYEHVRDRFEAQVAQKWKLYGKFEVDFRQYLLIRTCKMVASVTMLMPIRLILMFPAMKVRVLFLASLMGI